MWVHLAMMIGPGSRAGPLHARHSRHARACVAPLSVRWPPVGLYVGLQSRTNSSVLMKGNAKKTYPTLDFSLSYHCLICVFGTER